ncbi:hypothetical protein CLV30_11454 [Haloactinopolyspora alba]|uniref:Uncharacterized protein n=1 Tax=Haloactinopolyspora alba TaxID=648780 RepID=A0A2P8DVU2_9ACTN|nr:hypothetical protein [Haloactinopolyspora alba]PSL01324.1 hypothetical protein CLV30_11454 [Haloactinopolyspora alba]
MFPRWIPVLRGRRVPIGLAVGPAMFVAAIVTSAGLGLYRSAFDGSALLSLRTDTWAAIGPELLWPLWGVALAAGALGYYLRRRGTCRVCGRGAAT